MGGGKASILLNEYQALAPTQTDTNSACEPREEGCVRACVKTTGKGKRSVIQVKQEGSTSTGAAFVREAREADREWGGGLLSGRSELSDEGTAFHQPFLGFYRQAANEEISQTETQSPSCLVWPDTWVHEIILLRVNVASPLQSYSICQDLLILFLAEILQLAFKFQPKRKFWAETCLNAPGRVLLPNVSLGLMHQMWATHTTRNALPTSL